jgi:hypothetical protein
MGYFSAIESIRSFFRIIFIRELPLKGFLNVHDIVARYP